jgi:hypothetical protein
MGAPPIEGQAAGGKVSSVHDLGHVDRQLQALFGACARSVMADAEHADRAAIAARWDLGLHQFAMAVIRERDPLLVLDGYALAMAVRRERGNSRLRIEEVVVGRDVCSGLR